jgi:hypothetical protein
MARADDEFVVAVVNPTNDVRKLSIHDLRLIYGLYKRTWPGGVRIHVILPTEEGPVMKFLAAQLLHMKFEADVERFYLQAVVQQRIGARPLRFPLKEALDRIRSDPGAITLADSRQVEGVAGVRVIEIERD